MAYPPKALEKTLYCMIVDSLLCSGIPGDEFRNTGHPSDSHIKDSENILKNGTTKH